MSSDYANMMPEVVEAVHLMYEDYPDLETDCMLFLKMLSTNYERATDSVLDWFIENERCMTCGSALEIYTYKEPHPELDEHPYEEMTELYCPECGR